MGVKWTTKLKRSSLLVNNNVNGNIPLEAYIHSDSVASRLVCFLCYYESGCQCQCSWLPGNTTEMTHCVSGGTLNLACLLTEQMIPLNIEVWVVSAQVLSMLSLFVKTLISVSVMTADTLRACRLHIVMLKLGFISPVRATFILCWRCFAMVDCAV